jgi:hypothetical protein
MSRGSLLDDSRSFQVDNINNTRSTSAGKLIFSNTETACQHFETPEKVTDSVIYSLLLLTEEPILNMTELKSPIKLFVSHMPASRDSYICKAHL